MMQNFFRRFTLSHTDKQPSTSGLHHGSSSKSRFSVDWVLPGQLAVGRLPRATDGQVLQEAGIRTVFALCDESEGAWPVNLQEQFRCLRYVLPDSRYSTRPTAQQVGEVIRLVHHSIEKSEPVFVHCLAGIERSPSICTAYLCCYQHLPLWQALNWLKQVHPNSRPNDFQIQAIRDYLEQQQSWSDRAIV
ncbi:MAG: dual specificity protein phosphatase [Elainellaceae cyanobacterium]